MTSIDPQAVSSSIELLKQAKPLFESDSAYLSIAAGLLGTLVGAFASYLTLTLQARRQERRLEHSVACQIYAEIKGMLRIEEHRGFIKRLRETVGQFDRAEIQLASYQVQIGDDRFIVFKSHVQHLGVLPAEIQVNIILLYQLLESVLLDVKPGGLLNATEVGREPFEEALRMLERSRGLAHETLRQLEGKYPRLLKMAASA